MRSQPEDLILLVGSNPLPNYLAAIQLAPKRVHLIYTKRTEAVRRRLSGCLSDAGIGVTHKPEYELGDAADARIIRAVTAHLPKNAGLNYTGGTKTMATHVHAGWLTDCGGKDSSASYLDDPNGQLRFDDGWTQPLTLRLDLTILCKLHGLNHKVGSDGPGQPTDEEIRMVGKALIQDPVRSTKLYGRLSVKKEGSEDRRKVKAAELKVKPLQPQDLGEFGLEGLRVPVPGDDWNTKRIEAWIEFLRGEWLETWLGERIRSQALDGMDLYVDVSAWDEQSNPRNRDKGLSFQLDILVMRRNRLYAISCTTENTRYDLCKGKLFEVALRASQLGGDLTRFAFVCLLGLNADGQEQSAILERQAQSAWDAPNKPRVFGLSHVRNWLNGNTTDLREWLES